MMNNDNIEIIGIEIVEEAVELAKLNAKNNKINNYKYILGSARNIIRELKRDDIVIVDPPRKGLEKKLIDGIIKKEVNNIIYVSCNVNTLARDYNIFKENGYILKDIACVDMFPNTIHVETIVLLSKLDSKRYISVELPIDEVDLTSAESKVTYKQIQNYIFKTFGFKVSTLYIAQVKKKHGLEVRKHYNISKNENQKVPECPIEKEEAILDALKYFKMI